MKKSKSLKENYELNNDEAKLKYILTVSEKMYNDQEINRKHIEIKLHHFMYMWLAIIISMFTFLGKTINSFQLNEYN